MPTLLRRRPPSAPAYPAPARDRNWGESFPAYAVEGRGYLEGLSVLLGLCIIFNILVQNWEIAACYAALVDLTLLAAYYARRADCPHRFARILCAVYFATARNSATRRAVRRHVRLPVLFILGFLLFFAPRIRLPLGHDRPPLVDWRRLYVDTNWDYLRENRFFREPPPAATPPENP